MLPVNLRKQKPQPTQDLREYWRQQKRKQYEKKKAAKQTGVKLEERQYEKEAGGFRPVGFLFLASWFIVSNFQISPVKYETAKNEIKEKWLELHERSGSEAEIKEHRN